MAYGDQFHVGFTGTRQGMSEQQRARVDLFFSRIPTPWFFHHGDCIGADVHAHNLALEYGPHIHIHPPEDDRYRAHCIGDTKWRVAPYLERNRQIVVASHWMVVTPAQRKEQLRSGTWATYRYARQSHLPTVLIAPDGCELWLGCDNNPLTPTLQDRTFFGRADPHNQEE